MSVRERERETESRVWKCLSDWWYLWCLLLLAEAGSHKRGGPAVSSVFSQASAHENLFRWVQYCHLNRYQPKRRLFKPIKVELRSQTQQHCSLTPNNQIKRLLGIQALVTATPGLFFIPGLILAGWRDALFLVTHKLNFWLITVRWGQVATFVRPNVACSLKAYLLSAFACTLAQLSHRRGGFFILLWKVLVAVCCGLLLFSIGAGER